MDKKELNEITERRRHPRYQACHGLDYVKVIKDKDADGVTTGFVVRVEKGSYSEKKRFKDIQSAYQFVRELEHECTLEHDRKHQRIHSLNIIYYICLDPEGNQVGHGMGRTLNISQGGILLETYAPLDTRNTLLISIDTAKDLILDIKARPVYCKESGKGRYESGIMFLESNRVTREIVENAIGNLKEQISHDGD